MTKTKKRAVIMAALLAVFLLFAVFGRALAPNDPYKTDLLHSLEGPSAQFPFGTDNLGRCILSRVLEGASASIFSAMAVTASVFAFGTAVGILAGYLGGAADQLLMKITMIFQAFPGFILAVAVAGMLGPGLVNAMISLGLVYWTTYARLARSLVLRLRQEPYIQAARLCGAKKRHILARHILPAVLPSMVVTAFLEVGNVILSMAGLSFLGLGVQAPQAEWGQMISYGRSFLQRGPWCILFPSLALFAAVILFNLTGDCIRDALDVGGGE